MRGRRRRGLERERERCACICIYIYIYIFVVHMYVCIHMYIPIHNNHRSMKGYCARDPCVVLSKDYTIYFLKEKKTCDIILEYTVQYNISYNSI